MPNIFTYGSLMFDQVWSLVVKGDYDRCEATLHGYDRKSVRGEVYPVLFPSSPQSQIQGIIYFEVTPFDLEAIDRFEGEYYFRKTELVDTEEHGVISVEVFVLKEEYYAIISHQDWDPVKFSTTGIHFFIHNYMQTDAQ